MTTTLLENSYSINATVMIRRDCHENGMTLREYADAVINRIQPILNHDTFLYQFGSTIEDMSAVENFLLSKNLTIIKSQRDSATIKIIGTAEQFNLAFDIQMLQVVDANRSYISHTGTIKIPTSLQGIIQEVLGLDNSIDVTPVSTIPAPLPTSVSDPLSVPLTPQQMATAYNFPPSTGAGVCVGIIQFDGGYTTQNLTTSFAANGLSVPTIISYPAGSTNNPQDNIASSEVVLDSLMVGGTAPGAKQVVYFGTGTIQGWVNLFSAAVNDTTNNPSVLSVSWATSEASYWKTTVDPVFQAAIAKGITIVAASGDYGTRGPSATTTNPTVCYPAVSPYVLAIGGTTLQLNPNGTIANEFVWNQNNASSGSGISIIYDKPSWQNSLTSKAYPSGTIAVLPKRAIPDVAANADPATGARYYYGLSNLPSYTGGTSAATPLWAGLIACINQLAGRSSGFVNNKLYANTGGAFNDIIQGNNALPNLGVATGYSATIGWDAVTGLGSPKGNLVYNIIANVVKIKTASNTWSPVQNISIKTAANTWTTVNRVWTKTASGWAQTY